MYFCFSWFSNMVSFKYVFVVLNFLHDIFSIKFYTISSLRSFHDIFCNFFLLMRNITRGMLGTEVKVFHESISYFMKWPWNCISWNALKEKLDSVSLPLRKVEWKKNVSSSLWPHVRSCRNFIFPPQKCRIFKF